jgi:hypothetical protein
MDSLGTPMQREGLTIVSAGDETLIYDPPADKVHVLNPTALLIWQQCDGKHTPEEIADNLKSRFASVEDRDLLADVKVVLQEFIEANLITID